MAYIKDMTSGNPLPLILKFSLPLLLGNLLQQTYSIVDAIIVGKFLGINALASVGASTSVIFLILGFCNGCSAGFGIPIAQKFGARDYAIMRKYVANSLYLSIIISILIALISSLFCSDILSMMHTPGLIYNDAYRYLLITFIAIPFTFFYNIISSIIRAVGDSKTPFWFLLFSTILNILLDLLFIIVMKWGVAGAAISTLIAQGVSALLCYLYMINRFDILKIELFKDKFESRLAANLLYIGVSMGLQFSITAIGSIMLQSANNTLGTISVAAFTAAMRIKMFIMSPLDSLGVAMATYSGQNYGACNTRRIIEGVKSAINIMLVYCLLVFILIMTSSRYIAMLFVDVNELAILEKTDLFLNISVSFFPMLGLLCVLRYTIQGAGYTGLAMLSGVSEMVARVLVSLFAVPTFRFIAVCFGDPTAWIFADTFLAFAFIYVYKRLLATKDSMKQ